MFLAVAMDVPLQNLWHPQEILSGTQGAQGTWEHLFTTNKAALQRIASFLFGKVHILCYTFSFDALSGLGHTSTAEERTNFTTASLQGPKAGGAFGKRKTHVCQSFLFRTGVINLSTTSFYDIVSLAPKDFFLKSSGTGIPNSPIQN